VTKSKELILERIRTTLSERKFVVDGNIDFESPVRFPVDENMAVAFSDEIAKVNGNCLMCDSIDLFAIKLQQILLEKNIKKLYCIDKEIQQILEKSNITYSTDDFIGMQAAITGCELLVAEIGTIVTSSRQMIDKRLVAFPPIHFVIAFQSQLTKTLEEAFKLMSGKYQNDMPSSITLITGPSRTADIEKTLVIGAHGPKELFVLLVNDEKKL